MVRIYLAIPTCYPVESEGAIKIAPIVVICSTQELLGGVGSAVEKGAPATMVAPVHSESGDHNALPVCLGRENPNRLVSLWDMVAYSVADLHKVLTMLTREIGEMYRKERTRGAYDRLAVISDPGLGEFLHATMMLDCADKQFEHLEMAGGREQVMKLRSSLSTIGLAEYRSRLTVMREMIEDELKRRKFAYIPQNLAEFFEQAKPFGKKVAERFPTANKEACQGSNCIAASLGTAAVFHLIRCAEFGMRALAVERGVEIKNVESLEYAQWGEVLRALQSQRDSINSTWSRGRTKSLALDFYSGAIGELEGIKDSYRDPASHARASYTVAVAKDDCFVKVRSLLHRLSKYLREDDPSPIDWPAETSPSP
jgi:hypothetical protein